MIPLFGVAALGNEVIVVSVPLRRSAKSPSGMRRVSFVVRLTPEEKQRIELYARARGVSVSRYLVDAALDPQYHDKSVQLDQLLHQLDDIRAHLGKVGSNLNQVARHANTTGEVPSDAGFVVREVYDTVRTITRVLSSRGGRVDA